MIERIKIVQALDRLVDTGNQLRGQSSSSPKFAKWKSDQHVLYSTLFQEQPHFLNQFQSIAFSPLVLFADDHANYRAAAGAFDSGLTSALALLASVRDFVATFFPEISEEEVTVEAAPPAATGFRIFVIHGHNESAKQKLARQLEQFGLEPIILHEQANLGRTLIEKLEANSKVDLAIAIWTADDTGKASSEIDFKQRARQNVVFETGFFLGLLGRQRVLVLIEPGIELPSDYDGVVYIEIDTRSAWLLELGQQLHHLGVPVDLNKLLR